MTENDRLTEKRDGQNVIPLRQDGKTKWSLASAGMGDASTQFLYGTHADKLADYEAIGTIEELKALKEKAEPKKPLFSTIHRDSAYHCSSCKKFVGFYDTRIYEYCHNCGQKLDWSE